MKLEPDKHLFSREHVLADDLSIMLGENKKFAAYLGIAKRYYERDLRALARMVLEKQDLPPESRGRYFFGCLRKLAKIPGITLKPAKKSKKKNHVRDASHRQRTRKRAKRNGA